MIAINIFANLVGRFWLLAASILAVPIYINTLGVEAFGVVGFFTVLLATLQLAEFGFGVVINREIAQNRFKPDEFQETRDLVRSLEVVYWIIGLILGGGVYIAAPLIATEWLNNEYQSVDQVTNSIRLMGGIIFFQWPVSLYVGCLMGLERQVLLNVLKIIFGTLRVFGAIGVLWWISPTLEAFFFWHIIVDLFSVIGFAVICWRTLPHRCQSAKFNLFVLRKVWRFAAGLGATGLITFLLSNLDRLILSKLISLKFFGYYNIANQMNLASRMLPAAVFQAFFPRFSALFASGQTQQEELVTLYHRGSQLISLLVFPASLTLVFFSKEIIYIWLQNEEVASASAMIASVLILGSALNAMLGIPYEMTVARGWSTYGFYQNLVSAIFVVPLMLVLVQVYGALGAAIAWLILNIGYLVVAAPIIASRTLPKGELSIWYIQDIGRPLLICVIVCAAMRLMLPVNWPLGAKFIWIVATWILVQFFCLLMLPAMYRIVRDKLCDCLRSL